MLLTLPTTIISNLVKISCILTGRVAKSRNTFASSFVLVNLIPDFDADELTD
jgi:hypothetical protein